jgi:hypothetical protein
MDVPPPLDVKTPSLGNLFLRRSGTDELNRYNVKILVILPKKSFGLIDRLANALDTVVNFLLQGC